MKFRAFPIWGTVLLAFLLVGPSQAEPPSKPPASFGQAKKVARDHVYKDHLSTFYCACRFTPMGTTGGGAIDPSGCGYEPRKNSKRGNRLEWEHVMPASFFGRNRSCWRGHPACLDRQGKPYRGRECCGKPGVDDGFRRIEADLHNLVPAVGELNADRSNHPFGVVSGEPREYGRCDFEVGKDSSGGTVAEVEERLKGDVARIWLYMAQTYGVSLPEGYRKILEQWAEEDPISEWETERDRRIEEIQGNRNPFVRHGRN